MTELKPCPFCERIPVVEDCGTNRFFVRCKCGIAQDKLYWLRCDAVRRWNTRKGYQLLSAQPDFDITVKIDKAYDDGYKAGYMQGRHDWGDQDDKG